MQGLSLWQLLLQEWQLVGSAWSLSCIVFVLMVYPVVRRAHTVEAGVRVASDSVPILDESAYVI